MVQRINLNRSNSFVNWTRLLLLCEKFGAIFQVLVGLTAGKQVGGQAGRQSDQILVGSKILYQSHC